MYPYMKKWRFENMKGKGFRKTWKRIGIGAAAVLLIGTAIWGSRLLRGREDVKGEDHITYSRIVTAADRG